MTQAVDYGALAETIRAGVQKFEWLKLVADKLDAIAGLEQSARESADRLAIIRAEETAARLGINDMNTKVQAARDAASAAISEAQTTADRIVAAAKAQADATVSDASDLAQQTVAKATADAAANVTARQADADAAVVAKNAADQAAAAAQAQVTALTAQLADAQSKLDAVNAQIVSLLGTAQGSN